MPPSTDGQRVPQRPMLGLPGAYRARRFRMNKWFAKFATSASDVLGRAWVFLVALLVIVVWAVTGPIFGFSETWQLVINTSTTIITFLMVFLIQNTQNRDAMAMHLKLDELISSIAEADNAIINAEDETDEELAVLKQKYDALYNEHEELKARITPPAGNGKAGLWDARAPQPTDGE